MSKIFEVTGLVDDLSGTLPKSVDVTIELYDHRRNNPVIEFTFDLPNEQDSTVNLQMSLPELLDILSRCEK